jgi:hypothetical protein
LSVCGERGQIFVSDDAGLFLVTAALSRTLKLLSLVFGLLRCDELLGVPESLSAGYR